MKLIRVLKSNINTLYHITSLNGMKNIYDTNTLKGKEYPLISFTTNKNMESYLGQKAGTMFKLVLDGNKLSKNYELENFEYISNTNIKLKEDEVRTKNSTEIRNIDNYILGLYFIYNDDYEYFKHKLITKCNNDLNCNMIRNSLGGWWTYQQFFDFIEQLKSKYKFFNEPPSIDNMMNKENMSQNNWWNIGE